MVDDAVGQTKKLSSESLLWVEVVAAQLLLENVVPAARRVLGVVAVDNVTMSIPLALVASQVLPWLLPIPRTPLFMVVEIVKNPK